MIIVAIISTIALENYRTCVVNDMYFDRTRHLKRINQKKKNNRERLSTDTVASFEDVNEETSVFFE